MDWDGMAHANLEDVARLAGVSTKTVSRVINNESNVAAETLERVKRAIADLNYVPNAAARNLSRGRAMAIGMVVGWSARAAFFSMLTDSLLRDTVRRGYSLVLFPGDGNAAHRVHRALLGRQIDGVILDSPAGDDAELVGRLEAMGTPHVVIHPNHPDRFSQASFVRIDNFAGAKLATGHLIDLGHRRIGFVSFPSDRPGNERLSGYRAALEEAGIAFDPGLVYETLESPVQIGYRGALQLLPSHREITAIFGATDEIAMGALTGLWQLGLKIPDDVSVVGFDDIYLASNITPPLTTIHQPIDEISRAAVGMMVDMIKGATHVRRDVVLPTELVVRESCRPPRQFSSAHIPVS
jgi:DNA-binding LacI/PurR family transcriptional regulator